MIKRILTSSFVFSLILILFTQITCDSTEPPHIKSPRDYTWTADTVFGQYSSQTLMSSIWGSSENDVYMCGHSAGPGGGLWHFDGNEWLEIDLQSEINWHALYTAVHGTSAQNVWVVGYNGNLPFVVQYNGAKWIKHEIEVESAIYDVFVKDINDVWICGSNGIVAHYDKIYFKWNIDTVKINKALNEVFILYDVKELYSKIHLLGNKYLSSGGNQVLYYFQNNNNNWLKVDSFFVDELNFKWGSKGQFVSPNKELYSFGYGGIFKNNKINWSNVLNIEGISALFIQSKTNMICTGNFNIYHNDGNTWEKIIYNQNSSILLTGIWMNNNVAIIIGNLLDETPQKTIVLYGK